MREITGRLGVRHAIVGTVSVAIGRIKALIELVDGRSGAIRWTRRYDRPPTELPALVKDVSGGVAGALGGILGEIQRLERQLVRRKPVATLDAYEHYLLGCDAEARHDREGTFQALDHLERALAQDPYFARCWLILGWICNRIRTNKWSDNPNAWERREREAIEQALGCDGRDPLVLADAALFRALGGREAQALTLIERAADLVGNQADACVFLSLALAVTAGDGPRALAFVDRALALNPEPADWYSIFECRAAFYAGEYSRSIAASRAGAFADYLACQVYTLLSLAELGSSVEAAGLWSEMIRDHPKFDFETYALETPITHRAPLKFIERRPPSCSLLCPYNLPTNTCPMTFSMRKLASVAGAILDEVVGTRRGWVAWAEAARRAVIQPEPTPPGRFLGTSTPARRPMLSIRVTFTAQPAACSIAADPTVAIAAILHTAILGHVRDGVVAAAPNLDHGWVLKSSA